jgi:outer membrane receptor protein involved in Fe transport
MQKTRRSPQRKHPSALARLPLAAAIYFAISSAAFAQTDTTPPSPESTPEAKKTTPETPRTATLGTVTVTAQKRVENLQKVPISIQVLGNEQLQQQDVKNFEDYAKLLPSVSITPIGPGFGQVYMRGVANGGDGNHSTSLPSVGIYLDEQPITTIQGALDVHIYDVARIEALSGPQGTLYGASSEAGTIRIITNKPDPSGFASGYGVEVNAIDHGGWGHVLEGFVNAPINDHAAIRAVAWEKHDAGYIDNKLGSRTYPSWNVDSGGHGTVDNASAARDNYNDSDTYGARVALKLDINDSWSITPTLMSQRQTTDGNFSFDPVVGDLSLTHFFPETSDDRWTQAGLTVQGKIGNFDLVYAFAHLKRDVDSESDYNDYGFWYDTVYGYGAYFYDNNGDLVNPSQYIQGVDGYKKTSHELRISSPNENRFRFVAGVFNQDQFHDIQQRYKVNDLADSLSITGWSDSIWLTKQERRDHDEALFGEMSFDFTDKLTATAGMRYFRAHNSLQGFFGFSRGYSPTPVAPDPADFPGGVNDPDYIDALATYQTKLVKAYGEAKCEILFGPDSATWKKFNGAPCEFFNKEVKESGSLGRINVTYKFDDKRLIYATWSEGYRPGGVQRRGTLPNYKADFLTNYEIGWKTSWADNRLTWNGAIFQEDWKDFQFSVLGLNGLTDIRNATQAQIKGFETEVNWATTYNLLLSGGLALYDAKLTADYCGTLDANGDPETSCAVPQAPKGTQLPVTAKVKGNLNARYTFDLGSTEAYLQGTFIHEGKRTSDLRLVQRDLIGDMPAYSTFDFAAGIKKNSWSLDFFIKNVFDKRAQLSRFFTCSETVCGAHGYDAQYPNGQVYITPNQPRTFGIRFSQEF